MSIRFKAQVSDKQQLAEQLYKLELAVPPAHEFEFEAGQFMSLLVEGYIRRSYSLANPPYQTDKLATYIDTRPQGPGSKFCERVEVGEEVDLLAPLGHFIYLEPGKYAYQNAELSTDQISPAYFFATGTGVVPFLSMIRHELETVKSGRQMVLHYGVRYPEELIEIEMLNKFVQQYANFSITTYVSRSDEWQGNKGRMTSYIHQGISPDIDAYICGGWEMIQDVELLLQSQGVPAARINYERFY